MQSIMIRSKLIKIEDCLIFFDFEFIDFWGEVSEEDFLRVFRVFVTDKLFDIIFGDFEIIVLINTVKNKFEDALIIHKAKNSDSLIRTEVPVRNSSKKRMLNFYFLIRVNKYSR